MVTFLGSGWQPDLFFKFLALAILRQKGLEQKSLKVKQPSNLKATTFNQAAQEHHHACLSEHKGRGAPLILGR